MEDFRTIGKRVSNWGRWGPDDERGTINLITPEIIVAASRLVRAGRVFDLGIPFDSKGPQPGGGRINPIRLMSETGADQVTPGAFRFADDYVFMALQSGTQWDALAHVYYDDQLYNGFDATDVSVHGAAHCSIDKLGKGVIGRGVLLDIARQRGVDWLQAGEIITADDLQAAADSQGVAVGAGDILLFRTGWRRKFLTEQDPKAFMTGEPGLGMSCVDWLRDHDVAAICSDNWAIEVLPGEFAGEVLNVHMATRSTSSCSAPRR
jgi:kynurenine formamidase